MPESAVRSSVTEQARQLPVRGDYDVVVAGGGIAGVAAAIAAARNGVSVCLLDKMFALGGLATLGNVIIWLPLCDGMGRQVSGGLAEELLKLSVQDLIREDPSARFRGIPQCWQPGGEPAERRNVRYRAEFNPAHYLLALEKLVAGSGVKLLYDTRVCAIGAEGRRIRFLMVENKSGRSAIGCRTVVDASGDADVCFLAGEETESVDTNVPCGWFYSLSRVGLTLHPLSNLYSPAGVKSDAAGPFFRGDDAEHVTAQVLATRELIRNELASRRERNPEAQIEVIGLPSMACLRMTRRLVGSVSLAEHHVRKWFDDTVGLIGDWRKPGHVYSIPLRALHGVKMTNLLTAGRCISADTTAWDVARVIPACAVTGQAAGTAAALAVRLGAVEVGSLPARLLQSQLERQGVILDRALVETSGELTEDDTPDRSADSGDPISVSQVY